MSSTVDHMMVRLLKRLQAPAAQGTFIFVAIYSVIWGAWVLLFDSYTRGHSWDWLADIAKPQLFATGAILAGVAMAATVLRDTFPVVVYGAYIGFIFWGLMGMGFMLGDYHSTISLASFGLCLYSAFVYLNIRFNQKESK